MSEIIEKEERNQEIFEKNDGEINGNDLIRLSNTIMDISKSKLKNICIGGRQDRDDR